MWIPNLRLCVGEGYHKSHQISAVVTMNRRIALPRIYYKDASNKLRQPTRDYHYKPTRTPQISPLMFTTYCPNRPKGVTDQPLHVTPTSDPAGIIRRMQTSLRGVLQVKLYGCHALTQEQSFTTRADFTQWGHIQALAFLEHPARRPTYADPTKQYHMVKAPRGRPTSSALRAPIATTNLSPRQQRHMELHEEL